MAYKIAVIEFHQETNTFSPVLTEMIDFERFSLHYGEDVLEFAKKRKFQVAGFLKAVEKYGKGEFEVIPVYSAWAQSGGPVRKEVYEHFKSKALEVIDSHPDLDGIYYSLHGAMEVEGLLDPESDLLGAMRERLAPDFPIGVSFDLHANVTVENVRLATFINGYHTNPHRDFYSIGMKSGRLLMETVRGNIKPVMAFKKQRILMGGGMGIDFLAPLRGIIRRMKKMEKMPGVLSVSNFWVHIWIDDPELGWSTLAITDGNAELANTLAEELAERNWKVRDRKLPKGNSPEEAIQIAKKAWMRRRIGTVVFCDVSDVVGAGGPGESTWLLKALLENGPELISYVPLRDAQAAILAHESKVGDTVTLSVGGKLDKQYNQPLEFTGKIISLEDTQWGKTAILRNQGIHLLLTEQPFGAYFPTDFKDVGLNLWKADITVVKNLFPFRFRYAKFNRRTVNVISSGITNIDIFNLNYKLAPRPIYPLDEIEDWR